MRVSRRATRPRWLEGPWTGFQGVVQKVGFAEGVKCRVSSASSGGAGRSNDYSLETSGVTFEL